MFRLMNAALLGALVLAPVTIAPTALRADDRVYRDEAHHDEHRWDAHEDKAYRMWVKENHRHYENFERIKAEDQAAYWAWRHEHSDAVLKIDVR